jgi:nucleoside-diphosphate-sugar epimerase
MGAAMNILITGAGGYIGRNLAAHLAGEGHAVTALVRKATPDLGAIPNIKIIAAPDYHNAGWDGAVAFKNQDVVIHAASRVHNVSESGMRISAVYREDNTMLSQRLARVAQSAGVKRFLFLSSIGAYVLENRFHEGRITQKQAWENYPYRMSKLEAERGLLTLGKRGGMATSCVRLPMVYGSGAPGSFSTLIRIIQRGLPLPFESFTGKRAFVSIETVKDFVSYYLQHPAADGKIWAIRDGDEISPRAFATEVARAAHMPAPRFWFCPPWLLNLGARVLGRHQTARSLAEPVTIDLQPVATKLGWRPSLTVAEGLQKAFH